MPRIRSLGKQTWDRSRGRSQVCVSLRPGWYQDNGCDNRYNNNWCIE